MKEDPTRQKAEVRARVRALLGAISAEQKAADSRSACSLLRRQHVWQQARTVLFYAPLSDEVDVWPLLAEAIRLKKQIALPRFDPQTGRYVACQVENLDADLVPGQFGIREPAAQCKNLPGSEIALILVPGVAFDPVGHRLGRGKGYYDRLLAEFGGVKCGVSFEQQLVTNLPVEPHDARLNCVLTPRRWIEV